MGSDDLEIVLRMRDEATRVLTKFKREMDQAGMSTDEMSKDMNRANKAFKDADVLLDKLDQDAKKAGRGFRSLTQEIGGLVGGGAILYGLKRQVTGALGSFIQLEDQMGEIRKTSGLAGEDLDEMSQIITDIGQSEVPLATAQLREFAAIAGRAGIEGKENLAEFVTVSGQVAVALNGIDAEELLRTLGLTSEALEENGGATGNMRQFAATLNLLDDTSKTSAARIMELASDVAGAGAQFGLSYKPVLAWSTVLAEMNVESDIASTTILRLGSAIRDGAAEGGMALQSLAALTGMTSDEFKGLAQTDMAGAINEVLLGLKELQDLDSQNGSNLYSQALKQFELDAIQAQKAINPLVKNVEQLQERIAQVNDEPLAMNKFEAENAAQLELFSAQLQFLKNNFDALQASMGADFADALLPLVQVAADLLEGFTDWYNSLNEGSQKLIAFGVVGTTAIVGLLVMLGKLAFGLKVASAAMTQLGASTGVTTASMGLLSKASSASLLTMARFAGAMGIVVGAVAAVAIGMHDAMSAEEGLKVETEELTTATADLKNLLADPSATNAALAQAQALVKARLAEAEAARTAAVAELERRQAIASTRQAGLRTRVASGGTKDQGDVGAAFRAADASKEAELQKQEVVTANREVAAAKAALKEARERLGAGPQAITVPGSAGSGWSPSIMDDDGGASSAASKAAAAAKAESDPRGDALKSRQREVALLQEQLKALFEVKDSQADLTALVSSTGELRGNEIAHVTDLATAQDYLYAKAEALSQLREDTGDKTAQLSDAEIKAVADQVAATKVLEAQEYLLQQAIEDRYDEDLHEGMMDIIGMETRAYEEELAVLMAINEAKREGLSGSGMLEAGDNARSAFRRRQAEEDAQEGVDISRARDANKAFFTARMGMGLGDTMESQQEIAVLERKVQLQEEGKQLRADEEALIREEIAVQWELNEALQAWNDNKQAAMDAFDLVAGQFGDLIKGAKSFREALGDIVSGLADIALQYLVIIPLKRQFEQSLAGGGGAGGLLSILGLAKGGAFDGGSQFYADGDVFRSRRTFYHEKGVGVLGEAGPEAVMPLTRGRDGKLGVQSSGGGGGGQTVFSPNISVNVTASESEGDPERMGKIIGHAIEAKMSKFVETQSRPGGMLYGRR